MCVISDTKTSIPYRIYSFLQQIYWRTVDVFVLASTVDSTCDVLI